MSDRNLRRVLDERDRYKSANKRQEDIITRLNRKNLAQERVIQALEARLVADPRQDAERLFTGQRSKRGGGRA